MFYSTDPGIRKASVFCTLNVFSGQNNTYTTLLEGLAHSLIWNVLLPSILDREKCISLSCYNIPKAEVHTNNGLPRSVLSGRVSHTSSGDGRVPQLRTSSMVWIWQHDKRADYYKIILNCVRKLMKYKSEKVPNFKKGGLG